MAQYRNSQIDRRVDLERTIQDATVSAFMACTPAQRREVVERLNAIGSHTSRKFHIELEQED